MNVYLFNYDDIVRNNEVFFKYAFHNSNAFSIITHMNRPYSKRPPNCDHDEMLKDLQSYLLRQIVGIRIWSNDNASDNHTVMNLYESNRRSYNILYSIGDFLQPCENELPEDICFYKDNRAWISTVSHERLAFLYSDDEADSKFFIQNKIDCSYTGKGEPYRLPTETEDYL